MKVGPYLLLLYLCICPCVLFMLAVVLHGVQKRWEKKSQTSLSDDCYSNDPENKKGPKLKTWQDPIGSIRHLHGIDCKSVSVSITIDWTKVTTEHKATVSQRFEGKNTTFEYSPASWQKINEVETFSQASLYSQTFFLQGWGSGAAQTQPICTGGRPDRSKHQPRGSPQAGGMSITVSMLLFSFFVELPSGLKCPNTFVVVVDLLLLWLIVYPCCSYSLFLFPPYSSLCQDFSLASIPFSLFYVNFVCLFFHRDSPSLKMGTNWTQGQTSGANKCWARW